MRLRSYFSLAVLWGTFTCTTLTFASQPLRVGEWLPVRDGKMFGISGMAAIETHDDRMSFLVVHDNKSDDGGRLAIVTLSATDSVTYSPLDWPADWELPVDLESLTAVPPSGDFPESGFMAASSSGRVFYFRLDVSESDIDPIAIFDLPDLPSGSNLEGFALEEIEGRLLAVWADRGSREKAAIVYWSELDLANLSVDRIQTVKLQVPWPEGNVRHISDLKIDGAGRLTITSARDEGDDGPFDSAVYEAGRFRVEGNAIAFELTSQWVPLGRYEGRKIEAIELMSTPVGGTILGTDDENFGSSVMRLTQ